MVSAFREDFQRQFPGPVTPRTVFLASFELAVWAVAIFRFGKRAQRVRFAPLRKLLLLVYFFLYKTCEAVSGIRISVNSEIGPGLLIHNFGGVLICGRLGRNCTIVQGAQLISRSDGKASGWPTLGDDVYVGSGAKLVGNIRIGSNVTIGANAVVMTDIPDDSLVMPPESAVIRGYNRFKKAARRPAPDGVAAAMH